MPQELESRILVLDTVNKRSLPLSTWAYITRDNSSTRSILQKPNLLDRTQEAQSMVFDPQVGVTLLSESPMGPTPIGQTHLWDQTL